MQNVFVAKLQLKGTKAISSRFPTTQILVVASYVARSARQSPSLGADSRSASPDTPRLFMQQDCSLPGSNELIAGPCPESYESSL